MNTKVYNLIRYKPNDEYFTPSYAVKPILKYITKDIKIIWEPTDFGESKITKILKMEGYKVYSTSFNFLEKEIDKDYDMIITNPPYSLKTEFLERCYHLGKPFMMLLPITALEGIKRSELFRKFGIQVIIFDRRVNFITEKNSSSWFNTSWFCWKVLEKDLNFEKLNKK